MFKLPVKFLFLTLVVFVCLLENANSIEITFESGKDESRVRDYRKKARNALRKISVRIQTPHSDPIYYDDDDFEKYDSAFRRYDGYDVDTGEYNDKYIDFAIRTLETHNIYRAMHGAPTLALNKKLNTLAVQRAVELAKRDSYDFDYSKSRYLENIFVKCDRRDELEVSAEEPVIYWNDNSYSATKFVSDMWYIQIHRLEDFPSQNFRKLGVGFASSKTGKTFVVCKYGY